MEGGRMEGGRKNTHFRLKCTDSNKLFYPKNTTLDIIGIFVLK